MQQQASGNTTRINAGQRVDLYIGNTERLAVTSAGATVTGNATVTGTLDVNGSVLLGYRIHTCDYPNGEQHGDCSCGPGERVISGGTDVSPPSPGTNLITHGYFLRESKPLNETTWRVACVRHTVVGQGDTVHLIDPWNCSPITIICARVGN